MSISKSKGKRRLSAGIAKKCKSCGSIVKNTDAEVFSVTCNKCVSRMLNPNTIFVDELSHEEWKALIKKHYVFR